MERFAGKFALITGGSSNAGFDFRRYAMKPTPAKPKIIIAHVAGSGTAETDA